MQPQKQEFRVLSLVARREMRGKLDFKVVT